MRSLSPRAAHVRVISALALLMLPPAAAGHGVQEPSGPGTAPRRDTVVAGQQYGRPIGGRVLFGEDYRDLWTTPIEVELLDLQAEAGGLRPVMTIGGNESRGLALKGADGRDYSFRPVKKDLRGIVADIYENSVVADIVEDQVAATIPGVEVVKPVLAAAIGVLSPARARLVVLPDDPALGRFQHEFAHALGVLLEYPQAKSTTNPGFHDATQILGHKEFWERRRASASVRADSRAFLRARLLDLVLGDWDRHQSQWRWARLPGHALLQPIPEDADMAMSSYRGLALAVARVMGAPYVVFGGHYSPLPATTKNGWAVDRFLLTDLERSDWMPIVDEVRAGLSDAAIEAAIARLPNGFLVRRGAELRTTLTLRRDHLVGYAERFYRYLSTDVDVHGSDEADTGRVEWQGDGSLLVSVTQSSPAGSQATPYFRRRFDPRETREVRLYLHGGDDTVTVTGAGTSRLTVRIVGGPGDDTVDVASSHGLRLYDGEGRNRVTGGTTLAFDAHAFTPPTPSLPNDLPWVPGQDWGRTTWRTASASYSVGPGVTVGVGVDARGFGFRAYPWATRQTARAAWSFGAAKPLLDYSAVWHHESPLHLGVSASLSGLEQLRYFGRGNETPATPAGDGSLAISQYRSEIFPSIGLSDEGRRHISVGPYLVHSRSGDSDATSALARERPLGYGTFTEAGVRAVAGWDSRTKDDVFARGLTVNARGEYFAKGLDVDRAFGAVTGAGAATTSVGGRVIVSARLGGRKVFGTAPFFDAAYIDHRTTAGYTWNRFGGDASLYGGTDAHLILGTTHHVVPGDYGVMAFADAGRVYVRSEVSSKWHPAVGAGVFFAPFKRTSMVGVRVGKNDERWFLSLETRLARVGF